MASHVTCEVWLSDEEILRVITQPIHAFFAEAFDPFGDRLRRGVELASGSRVALHAIHHGAHHLLSTFRGQAGILVGVHSVLRESLRFGNISVRGPGRMDNLLKVHSLVQIHGLMSPLWSHLLRST